MTPARILPLAILAMLTASPLPAAPPSASPGRPPSGADAAASTSAVPIVIKNTDLVVLGEPGGKLVAGTTLWDLTVNPLVSKQLNLPDLDYRGTLAALSSDGKYLAVGKAHGARRGGKMPDDSNVDVTIYDTAASTKLFEVASRNQETRLALLRFTARQKLLVGRYGAGMSTLEVYDLQTAKPLCEFDCDFTKTNQMTTTPDGRYLTVVNNKDLQVYNIESGKSVLTAAPPPPQPARGFADGHMMMEGPNPFQFLAGLQFSPDGRELAGYFSEFDPRIVVWNTRGFVTDVFPLLEDRWLGMPDRATFTVSPDGSCWMINGSELLDRKTGRCVWMRDSAGHDDIRGAFLDPEHFFAIHSAPHQAPEVIALPMASIRKSLAAAADPKVPAVLRPGQSVSLELELQDSRGDAEATRKQVLDAVTSRLAADKITVADGQATILKMIFKEGIGEPVKTYMAPTRENRMPREIDTGTFEARALLTVNIMTRGSDKVYFTGVIGASRRSSKFDGSPGDPNRADLLRFLPLDICRIDLPYFIPQNPELEMLPMGYKPRSYPANYLKPAPDSADRPPPPPRAPK